MSKPLISRSKATYPLCRLDQSMMCQQKEAKSQSELTQQVIPLYAISVMIINSEVLIFPLLLQIP